MPSSPEILPWNENIDLRIQMQQALESWSVDSVLWSRESISSLTVSDTANFNTNVIHNEYSKIQALCDRCLNAPKEFNLASFFEAHLWSNAKV